MDFFDGTSYGTIDYPSANYTYAFGLNDQGLIVGTYSTASGVHGFIKNHDTYSPLDVPDSLPGSIFATEINDNSSIVGWFSNYTGHHGFLYHDGLYTVLDAPMATREPGPLHSDSIYEKPTQPYDH